MTRQAGHLGLRLGCVTPPPAAERIRVLSAGQMVVGKATSYPEAVI